jgi:hypothetical protein
MARLLHEVAQSDELGKLPAFAPERLATTTRFFLNLVVVPLFLRALYGQKLKVLDAEIGPQAAHSVAFFVAGYRRGADVAASVDPADSLCRARKFPPAVDHPSSRGSRCLCCAKDQSI